MNDWILLLPSLVFSRIKNGFSQSVIDKYGLTDKHFSTVNKNNTSPTFPFIFVQNLTSVERGMDLEGKTINAVMYSFQVDVYDNKSQSRAREVMGEVMNTAKNMSFQVLAIPEFEKQDDGTYRCTARFRRMIGSGDAL